MKARIILSIVACAVLSGCGASSALISQADLDSIAAKFEKAKREAVTTETLTEGSLTTTTTWKGQGTVVESAVTTKENSETLITVTVTENTLKQLENSSSKPVIKGYVSTETSAISTTPDLPVSSIVLLSSNTFTSEVRNMALNEPETPAGTLVDVVLPNDPFSEWVDTTLTIDEKNYAFRIQNASQNSVATAMATDLCHPTSQCSYSYFVSGPLLSNMPTTGGFTYAGGLMFGVVEEPAETMEYGDFVMTVSFDEKTARLTSDIKYEQETVDGTDHTDFSMDSGVLTIDMEDGTFSGDTGTFTDESESLTIDGVMTYGRFVGEGALGVVGVLSTDKVYVSGEGEDAMVNVSGSFAGELQRIP